MDREPPHTAASEPLRSEHLLDRFLDNFEARGIVGARTVNWSETWLLRVAYDRL